MFPPHDCASRLHDHGAGYDATTTPICLFLLNALAWEKFFNCFKGRGNSALVLLRLHYPAPGFYSAASGLNHTGYVTEKKPLLIISWCLWVCFIVTSGLRNLWLPIINITNIFLGGRQAGCWWLGAGLIRVVYPHITAAGRSKDNTSTTEGSSDSKADLGGNLGIYSRDGRCALTSKVPAR